MKWRNSRLHRSVRDNTGATIVETALMLPLLLVTTFAVFEFGAMFFVYLSLENGVSQATRYGVTGNAMPNLTRDASIMSTMRQATPVLTIDDAAFSFSHLTPGSSSWTSGSGGPGDIEKVTVDYTWRIITPLLWPLFNSRQLHFQVASSMKNESRFQ